MQAKFEVDMQKVLLSSKSIVKKTENFISQTKYILDIDFFISQIAGNLVKEFDKIFSNIDKQKFVNDASCFKIETSDKAFGFLIKFGFQFSEKLSNEKDIIFYKFLNNSAEIRQNDIKIRNYLQKKSIFSVFISSTTDLSKDLNFNKLYRLSNSQNINFPLLSAEQLKLVETENQNVIIQGVAGSGKTNVCIEKLVYVASKNYGGKILYTTFSRGLLNDTKLKVDAFKNNLKSFLEKLENNNVVFLDENHKKAIENYLGIFFFVDEENISKKIKKMISFFENQVDYFLIEDLYKKYFEEKIFADEEFFVKNYLKNIKNYQISNKLPKLKNLSNEIIYKEIFGLIFGFCAENKFDIITENEYIELRKNSFQKYECETIYQIALDYQSYISKNNMTDNNFASREMLKNLQKIPRYSLVVADEVQDFSQINLLLFKNIALKLFCTGDALQMINPSYFSFSYLKNLLYEKDIISVAELKNNYRNTLKIQEIIDGLEEINIKKFGTHNFITTGKGIDNNISTTAIYCNDNNFASEIAKNKYDNFTIVVATKEQKQNLRKILKNQEILTVAEIKGLERDVVLLYNLLTDNQSKWELLERIILNKKSADENSVFRYYFNMFYVGISRAKRNLFVLEEKNVSTFSQFFKTYFDCQNSKNTINALSKIVSKIEYTQSEYLERVEEFIKLGQYDNARFTVEKITDDLIRKQELIKIEINENYVHHGKYREAGIKFWEEGMLDEAKKQFTLSGDTILIDLIDALSQNNQSNLNYDIIRYYTDLKDNEIARKFVLETIKRDLKNLQAEQKELHDKIKKLKENKNGKWQRNSRVDFNLCWI